MDKKKAEIEMCERTIEILKKEMVNLRGFLKMHQERNDEYYVGRYEKLMQECGELLKMYNDKLRGLKEGAL